MASDDTLPFLIRGVVQHKRIFSYLNQNTIKGLEDMIKIENETLHRGSLSTNSDGGMIGYLFTANKFVDL
jgi:hypothetical protein